MKFRICFLLLVTLMVCQSHDASAQFWKEWFKKSEKKRKPAPKKDLKEKPEPEKSKPSKKKKRDIEYPTSVVKSVYRVDVLAPLYLDELVKDNRPTFKGRLPEKAAPIVSFIEGVQLAADTFSTQGYRFEIYIHDVTDSNRSLEKLIADGVIDSTDLIIGAISSQQIPPVAAFAKKRQINFVSALSPADGDVKDNPYFTLLQPTLDAHCEYVVKAIEKKYPDKKFTLLYRNSVPVDENAFSYVMDDVEDEDELNMIPLDSGFSKDKLLSYIDSNVINILLVAVLDNDYAESLLKQLYDWYPAYDFEVFGMPSWKMMGSLKDAAAYPNVAVNITFPFYFDPTTQSGRAVANNYKRNYGGRPNDLVYRGYETMIWYGYLLRKYGMTFNKDVGDSGVAPFTRFDVKPKWDTDDNLLYNVNKHMYLYRYRSGSYMVEQ